jgi:hypothetical protein
MTGHTVPVPGAGDRPELPDPTDPGLCLLASQEAAVSLLCRTEPAPAVRAHLATCPSCNQEYRELAALIPMLAGARDAQSAEPPPAPSPLLLDRLLAHVARRRRRRRAAVGVALAAAAAAAIAIPLVDLSSGDDARRGPVAGSSPRSVGAAQPAPSEIVALGAARAGTAMGQVWIRKDGSGSTVTVSVSGVTMGTRCRMIVHDASGRATDAGWWTLTQAESTYVEDVATPPAGIQRIELVDERTGGRVLEVTVRQV